MKISNPYITKTKFYVLKFVYNKFIIQNSFMLGITLTVEDMTN